MYYLLHTTMNNKMLNSTATGLTFMKITEQIKLIHCTRSQLLQLIIQQWQVLLLIQLFSNHTITPLHLDFMNTKLMEAQVLTIQLSMVSCKTLV